LPGLYDPKKVIALLNGIKDDLLCVIGNCDCDVDQMVLEFPIMADYALLYIDGITIYATHGHVYNQKKPLPGTKGILLCGHTHVPKIEECDGFTYLNPGSVSIPKEGSRHSYMVLEDGVFKWKDLESKEVYMEYKPVI
ncbi:MAG: phosphodiesterase, partial [Erysipelotrichaceae bacterium]|nr:phosphodiesterase [Erysipelotrichaceae bacterium]